MPEKQNIFKALLSQIGSSREVNQYLNTYAADDTSLFAVIKVGGGILRDSLAELASALALLHYVGLRPIIIHGAGPQVDAALESAGIACEKRDNLRVTTESVMAIARPIIYKLNHDLVQALESHGVRARGIQHGIFKARFLDESRYGFVGDIIDVNTSMIHQAFDANALPVLTCLGETAAGQMLNINADIATRELVWATKPKKIIFLTLSGGLLDENNQLISAISLVNDYESLIAAPWVHSGMLLKLQQIKAMLDNLDATVSVSMTSANQLARELFTHKGAGTLIRKGESFTLYETPTPELLQTTVSLIESAFGKPLKPDWLAGLASPQVLLSASQRAAAVVVAGQDGMPYLDKFIVTPKGQGEGLGAAVWQALCQHFPAFYWRSRSSNPITPWYFSKADTSERHGEWVIFSIGVNDSEARARLAEDALSRDSGWQNA